MTGDLPALRREMDEINEELLTLFCRRMALAGQIGAHKKARALPVRDETRETQILEWAARRAGPELAPYAGRLFDCLMALAREYQQTENGQAVK